MRKLLAIATLLLAGCSFTPRDVGYDHVFTLKSLAAKAGGTATLGVLRLNYPTAPAELSTYRIAVIRADGKQDYIADARWSDFLPEILAPALEQTLKSSGRFSFVEPDDGGTVNDLVMNTEIDRFDVSYAAGKSPVIEISLSFSLQKADGTPLAHFTAARKVPAPENSMTALSSTFQRAFAGIESEISSKVVGLSSSANQ